MPNALDKGVQFTDRQYLSKEEVQAHYNLDDVESIWSDIQGYRALFRVDLPARSGSGLPFYAVLTPSILNRLTKAERRLFLALVRFERLPGSLKEKVRKATLCNELEVLSEYYELGVTRPQIEAVVDGRVSDDLRQTLLSRIAREEESLIRSPADRFDSKVSDSINAGVQDESPESLSAQPTRIAPLFRILDSDEDLPLVLRFLLVFLWFSTARPYEYSSEVTAGLLARAFLSNQGFETMPYCLSVSNIYLNRSTDFLKATDLSIKTRDVDYFLREAVPLFEEDISQLESDISRMERESPLIAEEAEPRPEKPRPVEPYSRIAGERKKAQTGPKPVTNVSDAAAEMLEDYPVLKAFQAEFYLSHRTIGKFYTLKQFEQAEDVVYETARTSMELLCNLGFYRKGKAGKKFTYTPIPKDVAVQSGEDEKAEKQEGQQR